MNTPTPRERVEIVLHGGCGDSVPFTIYECMIPQTRLEREMRNRGMCIVDRRGVFKMHRPNVKVTEERIREDGRNLVRTHLETPAGTVSLLTERAGFTTWVHERLFRSPDDYKVIEFLIRDEIYEEDYASYAAAQDASGGDSILRAQIGLEPLQELISGRLIGMETFCFEWMERRDEILKLYQALVEKRREVYPLVAKSPAMHANYGGNVVPEVIGLDAFEKYYLSHYEEAAEIMHQHGKLIGCHFDANCRLLAKAIGSTGLDYIEAFTPSPDTDMTVSEARVAWPDKVLWINFPSSQHLLEDEAIEEIAAGLAEQACDPSGFLVGITEDIPSERWQHSCPAIMNGLERHAVENPERYG
ncbi:MAG: hypothetical protein DRP71_12415 [Verrucomicrobia bacterium]|nr:MAG: hypothetical protein DRP71_12415 [Verrucomicrobiota bacterium]